MSVITNTPAGPPEGVLGQPAEPQNAAPATGFPTTFDDGTEHRHSLGLLTADAAADGATSDGAKQDGATPALPAGADLRVVPARHPWRWVGTVLVTILVAAIAYSLATNPRWEWGVVAQWFTAQSVVNGLLETLKLTVIAGTLGFLLGFVLALMRLSASPLLVGVAWTFSWIFRSTPLLVQLLLWYNLGYLYEKISLGIPFTDVRFFEASTTTLISQFAAAVLGLSLNQAAYSAEIIRGGILSVDAGQLEAAAALGIPAWRRNTRIVLPQAMRAILPNAFNEIIGLVKGTSVVYVLAYSELFYTVQVIYNRTQQVLPLLLVATLWYVVITSVLSVAQYYIERHYSRGSVRNLPPTPWQRIRANLAPGRRPALQPAAQTTAETTGQEPARKDLP
ncbi:polar amino acid transport system permease protein [Arthrobacter woluwensis]|uniref:amino acid ABC transporter permease n=1 Tax=Arthrobacter woluwensis TaxID=156980 RepID=UPI00277D25F3|nr:amino acid ABC transporter permease [Arthrobacter woluwensis]MDQ0707360.1 polar amino acid transport system permease protein [Arthrobacter woluwensis]